MRNTFDYIALKESLALGIPVIDNQHAHLVRIANKLNFVCHNGSKTSNSRLLQSVHEAVDFVRQHFNTEEKLMLLSAFPGYVDHKKEHKDFIEEVLSCSEQFQDGQNLTPQKFARFFSEWVKSHIGVSDKEFAGFFIDVSQRGKLKLMLADELQLSIKSA